MKKGQYFIIGAAIIAMLVIPSFMLFSQTQREDTSGVCSYMFLNLRDQFRKTIDLTISKNNSLDNLENNLNNFSNKMNSFCTNNLYCNFSYFIEQVSFELLENILFEDNFEGYNYTSGPDFFSEMENNGWEVYDHYWDGDPDIYMYDDVFLQNTDPIHEGYYIVIQDDSHITRTLNASEYSSINLQYDRRTFTIKPEDRLRILWRIGDSGGWIQLEEVINDSFDTVNFDLEGAEGQETVQIRFFMDNGNDERGLVDNIIIKGLTEREPNYNVTLNFTFICNDVIIQDNFIYFT